jgi:hypothetical protein|tara:strand:+ start:12183 stop:12632 length:450 start_codon:yes stop_codon:yes gene_type:complete
MTNWIYKNQEVTEMSDFPDNTYGFVYVITHLPTGKKYIGKKILFFTRKVKLGKKDLRAFEGVVGRRPSYKLAIKESDWRTYFGSNKEMQELIKSEPNENWEREILVACSTKKLLTYFESKYLFVYQTLEKPDEFWNDNILGKFFTKDFD